VERGLSISQVLVLIHTVPSVVGEFQGLCGDVLPDVQLFNVLDEPLLERIRQRGHSNVEDDARLLAHVELAEAIGASAVLVTCSTVSLCVDSIRDRSPLPIVKIDDAMAAKAVEIAGRISVVATNATTLEPSRVLLESEARRRSRRIVLSQRLVEGALAALMKGDGSTHDRLVDRAVREEAEHADVVVLAQASMARVLPTMAGAPTPVPVLSSPRLALWEVQRILIAGRTEPAAADLT
jgi:Asp/Glu/hydantoin racemase